MSVIEELRRLDAEATDDWEVGGPYPSVSIVRMLEPAVMETGFEEPAYYECVAMLDESVDGEPNAQALANARLIARLRTLLPLMLAEIEAGRAVADWLHDDTDPSDLIGAYDAARAALDAFDLCIDRIEEMPSSQIRWPEFFGRVFREGKQVCRLNWPDEIDLAKAEWDPFIGPRPSTPVVRTSMGIDQFLTENEVDFDGVLTEEMIRKAANALSRYNMVPVPSPSQANGVCTLECYRGGRKLAVFRLDVWDNNPPKHGFNPITVILDLD